MACRRLDTFNHAGKIRFETAAIVPVQPERESGRSVFV